MRIATGQIQGPPSGGWPCVFALLFSLSVALSVTALATDYHETFAEWKDWYGGLWHPDGFIQLEAERDVNQILPCPSGFYLASADGEDRSIVDVSVDLRFVKPGSAGGFVFHETDRLDRVYVLAIEASGRWNLFHRAVAETVGICDLDIRIGARDLHPWRVSPHFSTGSEAVNRLTIRFQSERVLGASRSTVRATAFLNGREVTALSTDLPADRPLRLFISAFCWANGTSVVQFDDLRVVTQRS